MLTEHSAHLLCGAVCGLALLLGFPALADIHYAGGPYPGGEPPYATPETAAWRIQDALDAAESGDTVQVLTGTYWKPADDAYVVKDYVNLLGSGPANTRIIGQVVMGDGGQVRGFRFTGGSLSLAHGWRVKNEVGDCVFDGAVLSAAGIEAEIAVRRCTFRNLPRAASAVSALYSGMTITDCVFELADRAADAVVFEELNSPAVIYGCKFTGCRSAVGVGIGNETTRITNCLFKENDVAISAWGRPFQSVNCTFYRNGCAVLTVLDLEEEIITNSIIWGNTKGILEYQSRRDYFDSTWREERAMPVITFSLVETNLWWTYPGRGNMNGDPSFFSPEFEPDLHLYAGSPCVDAGDPFSDYSHEPEPNGGRINMGAYGGTWEATTSELVDMDGDYLRDDWEVEHFGTLDRDGIGDADADGLSDRDEYRYLANPNNPDTDGDGLPDGEEVFNLGTDPTSPDTDNDGTPDAKEVMDGTDPLDPWDALSIIALRIENDQVHVVHPVQPRCWYELQSSFFPGGPFGIVCPDWEGRFGVPTHTFVVDVNPFARFYRIEARPY